VGGVGVDLRPVQGDHVGVDPVVDHRVLVERIGQADAVRTEVDLTTATEVPRQATAWTVTTPSRPFMLVTAALKESEVRIRETANPSASTVSWRQDNRVAPPAGRRAISV
jgi:hypothetical protein